MSCLLLTPVYAAKHNGRNIDGKKFHAEALCIQNSQLYDVDVKFKGDTVSLYFPKKTITLTLIDTEIEEDCDIKAYDKDTEWILAIEKID